MGQYKPETDSPFDQSYRGWLDERETFGDEGLLDVYSDDALDEFRSVCDSKMSCEAWADDAMLAAYRFQINALLMSRIERCDLCEEPTDFCRGHGELNGRTDEDVERAKLEAKLNGLDWGEMSETLRAAYVRMAMELDAPDSVPDSDAAPDSPAAPALTEEESGQVEWIRETLIPDFRESGMDETANDLACLVRIIDRLTGGLA